MNEKMEKNYEDMSKLEFLDELVSLFSEKGIIASVLLPTLLLFLLFMSDIEHVPEAIALMLFVIGQAVIAARGSYYYRKRYVEKNKEYSCPGKWIPIAFYFIQILIWDDDWSDIGLSLLMVVVGFGISFLILLKRFSNKRELFEEVLIIFCRAQIVNCLGIGLLVIISIVLTAVAAVFAGIIAIALVTVGLPILLHVLRY